MGASACASLAAAPLASLRLAYSAHLGDAQPVAAQTLTLEVPAALVLSVSPHVASVGRSIRFRGRLRGRPVPRGGKQLVLEARSPGSAWIEFKVVRTDAQWALSRVLPLQVPGPGRLPLSGSLRTGGRLPFAGGSSNVVAVHEL